MLCFNGVFAVLFLQDNVLKEYPANIVLIEPLANMTAIEDFLWPRVNRGSTAEALRAKAAEHAAAAGTNGRAADATPDATAPRNTRAPAGSGTAAAAAAGTSTGRRRSSNGTGSGRDMPASKTPAASNAQPIPDAERTGGRMTRAQAARARAEAQARAEAAAQQRQARRGNAGSAGGSSDPLSEEHDGVSDEDMLMRYVLFVRS